MKIKVVTSESYFISAMFQPKKLLQYYSLSSRTHRHDLFIFGSEDIIFLTYIHTFKLIERGKWVMCRECWYLSMILRIQQGQRRTMNDIGSDKLTNPLIVYDSSMQSLLQTTTTILQHSTPPLSCVLSSIPQVGYLSYITTNVVTIINYHNPNRTLH